ncbi:membrane-bound O-acyltransferase domain containing protein, putative [Entamoeba invadens IP1]|uniref:Membrane-bound O-acyltransferase domain containing protein, putative n=1 Tax=Entamoeba invadens IP1 TaxID=370355 RepID=A0A0A1TUQ2_ENTIV|nr:membrane-bound O-acyltransferase domain containing protein, putative [Entamoeba invadens IP1]ELP83825.1 membrane-bound O-acyltransferase domain containing protein, putative [Entamoeba invadens IP1]|eukprot:XP_004183171.1 membrane-bound O-acyltransferase domain containing protein, putative [Entamoeba invadens IP1]
MGISETILTLWNNIPTITPHYFTVALLFIAPVPLSLVSRHITNRTARVWFIILTSVISQWICFQEYMLHGTLSILITYILMKTVKYPYAHYLNLIIQFIYVLYGHAWRMYNFYLIYSTDWTILQMMLIVRLSCITWDRSLSFRPENEVKPRHKHLVMKEDPSLTDLFAYCYHLPGMLIGPNVDFNTFYKYLDLSMFPNKQIPVTITTKAFITRLIELFVIYCCGVTSPVEFTYVMTDDFVQQTFLYRLGYLLVAHYTNMSKYLFMFVAGELACVGCGISYYVTEKGQEKFAKFRNIRITKILTARGLKMFASNWNLGIVDWVTSVVNDIVPDSWGWLARHALTYIMNAFWHGLYPGYLLFFFCCGIPYEFCSRRFLRIINTYINKKSKLYWVWQVVGMFLSLMLMIFCHIAFNLMAFSYVWKAWTNLYFYFYVMLAAMYVLQFVIPPLPASYWDDKGSQQRNLKESATKKEMKNEEGKEEKKRTEENVGSPKAKDE